MNEYISTPSEWRHGMHLSLLYVWRVICTQWRRSDSDVASASNRSKLENVISAAAVATYFGWPIEQVWQCQLPKDEAHAILCRRWTRDSFSESLGAMFPRRASALIKYMRFITVTLQLQCWNVLISWRWSTACFAWNLRVMNRRETRFNYCHALLERDYDHQL